VTKRLLVWTGLFLAGVLIGFEVAWVIGLVKNPPRPRGQNTAASANESEVIVTLTALIDGSDRFVFTRDGLHDEHGRWASPANVFFNGEPWDDLSQTPLAWLALAPQLDLSRARISSREGRDMIALERTADGFDIVFADTQMGAANYSVSISVPRK